MNFKRILSAFLALMMVLSAAVVTANAADETTETTPEESGKKTVYEDYFDAKGEPVIDYTKQTYATPEAKLEDMVMVKSQDGYELYYEYYTGEIAFKNVATGEILFSNPYDINNGYNWASPSTKRKLLSQLFVEFEENGVTKTLESYTEAAVRKQINLKNIKNGIRVEYTVGELAIQRLVPRIISKNRFESMILNRINVPADKERLKSFYTLYDTSDPSLTERLVKEIQASFPITRQFAIYVCNPDIETKELKTLEDIVKLHCPNYTFEEMEQDHADCDYVASDKAPANFKMAIEYTISPEGLEARLPASGIRFDESNFALKSVTMLPYMGCGSFQNEGYTFFPDGSGTLIRFEDVIGKTYNVSGEMYGADYAYHDIKGKNSETLRLPVFGVVENREGAADSPTGIDARGYFAIITEGDSMAKLMSEHGGELHAYNTVYASFIPRPSDRYNLADSMSIGSNAVWTITSPRKYTGSYRIKYIMLDDKSSVEQNGGYEASYVGMAEAYRDYLEGTGAITKLTSEQTGNNMPLYIESFGSIKTNEKFLSLPITVDTPLTSFNDVSKIYSELSEAGVSNINFRLTGYYNGGLDNTYPVKLDWVKNVGGKEGFTDILAEGKSKNFGVYPEFDLAYVKSTAWFDGIDQKQHMVKSIDDRYMSKRNYDAAMQSFESDFALAISPSVYNYFADKLEKNLAEYKDLGSISVSTLGTELNSDFDEDDPYNREDSRGFTVNVLESLDSKYNVMIDGGNAYAFPYADHIINVPTESSNYLRASESVPFYAMVLHGYVNYSASALNMEGDVRYAILKSIENGASLYFTLCYENTSALKENEEYNRYYSVAYDIWKDDIVKYYGEINKLLGDLQSQIIVSHDFLEATRTVDAEDITIPVEVLEDQLKALREELARLVDRKAILEDRGRDTANIQKDIDEAEKSIADLEALISGDEAATKDDVDLIAVERGSVVMVTYEDGTKFVINYNSYDVDAVVDGHTVNVKALGYVEIDKDYVFESAEDEEPEADEEVDSEEPEADEEVDSEEPEADEEADSEEPEADEEADSEEPEADESVDADAPADDETTNDETVADDELLSPDSEGEGESEAEDDSEEGGAN